MRASRALASLAVAGLLIAGCSSPVPTASTVPIGPVGTGGTTAGPSGAIGTPGPTLPSQTDTAWGRIWDALPDTFPGPPGTQLATDTGEGASSGQLVAPAARDAVVQFYRDAFRDQGYVIGTDGPLEDGSVTVTATDTYQCRIQVSIRGVGDQESIVTVLFGSGCPFE